METKKYRATSIVDAISRIKKELGPDALIVSTKKITKSVTNPYVRDMVEVEAMPNNSVQLGSNSGVKPNMFQSDRLPSYSAKPAYQDSSDNNMEWQGFFETEKNNRKLSNRSLNKEAKIEAILSSSKPKEKEVVKSRTTQNDDYKNVEQNEDWSLIKDELINIKDMLYFVTQSGLNNDFLNNYPETISIYTKLIKFGITERCVQNLIDSSYKSLKESENSVDDLVQTIFDKILKDIKIKSIFGDESNRINAFVGPTGVGKTTTIAKLAALLSLKEKKKIGLISIDNYRIGAIEQLKAYASIIGIPCISAFTTKDLKEALNKMQNFDVVLIDTAGHSHLDSKKMQDLKKLIRNDYGSETPISTHLVLSSTTSKATMNEAYNRFNILKSDSYIFTKIDETNLKGSVVEQIMDFGMPISYITNGQRVPEDIMKTSKKNILNLLLN